jgi:hypothetical protein
MKKSIKSRHFYLLRHSISNTALFLWKPPNKARTPNQQSHQSQKRPAVAKEASTCTEVALSETRASETDVPSLCDSSTTTEALKTSEASTEAPCACSHNSGKELSVTDVVFADLLVTRIGV